MSEKRKEKAVSRSVEQKLREAIRYVGSDGEEKPKPIQNQKRRPSAMEKRLMDAKKAFKRR
jgi:hypothetical protein